MVHPESHASSPCSAGISRHEVNTPAEAGRCVHERESGGCTFAGRACSPSPTKKLPRYISKPLRKPTPPPEADPVEKAQLVLRLHEAPSLAIGGDALQPDLQDAGAGEGQHHHAHADGHHPEGPHLQALRPLRVGLAATQDGHGVADHRDHHHHIGAVEGQVPVSGRDLAAVGVVVDRAQCVDEAPEPAPRKPITAQPTVHSTAAWFGVLALAALDHVEGEQRHREEGDGLQRAEDRPDPLPVAGRPMK